jgi:hypothetical protein
MVDGRSEKIFYISVLVLEIKIKFELMQPDNRKPWRDGEPWRALLPLSSLVCSFLLLDG